MTIPQESPRPYRVLLAFHLPEASTARLRGLAGVEVVQLDTNGKPSLADFEPHFCKGIDAMIITINVKVDQKLLTLAAPHLKIITTASSGFEHIDLAACRKAGVRVANSPAPQMMETMADTTLMLMLGAARRANDAAESVMSGQWAMGKSEGKNNDPLPRSPPSIQYMGGGNVPRCGFDMQHMCGQDVHSSTVGIVGLGRIGQALARRLRGFNCKLLYTGRTERPELSREFDAEFVSLDDLLRRSDFVVALCPLTPQTEGMFDKSKFALMKRTAVFVNMARGGIVKQDDLVEALRSRRIYAAGLDVMTPEPIEPDHDLVKDPFCYMMPHAGSGSYAARKCLCDLAVDGVLTAFAGKVSPYVLNE